MMSEISRRTFLAAITGGALLQRPLAKVKLGVCTNDVAGAVRYGFEYIEPSAADIAGMSEDKFREYAGEVLSSPIRCDAFNSFIRRPELVVLGNEVPTAALNDYMEACLARCRKLGASIVVWGSAGSRKGPDGFPRELARRQNAELVAVGGATPRVSEIR